MTKNIPTTKSRWKIQGIQSTTVVFKAELPGGYSNGEIATILQRLACRHLTDEEIISASLRKGRRTSLLETKTAGPPHGNRLTIWIDGATVDYIAGYWRPGAD
jgi:hypothetical protein